MEQAKTLCESPIPGEPGTEIESWKFYVIRRIIMRVLEENEAGVSAEVLPDKVEQMIGDSQTKSNIGFVPWYTQVVKLDMEAKKQIEVTPEEDTQRIKLIS